jgi:mRNA interferase MazF
MQILNMERGEVWFIELDPTRGSEQAGRRPCVIVSHESLNTALSAVVIVPLSTKSKKWPTRVNIKFKGLQGQALCEQIRTISKERLVNHSGSLNLKEIAEIRLVLRQMFFD